MTSSRIALHRKLLINCYYIPVGTEFLVILRLGKEPGQLSGIALDYGLDDRGFESRQGLGIFLFTTTSRPALGPTQPPI
jgi:hypothetical protein